MTTSVIIDDYFTFLPLVYIHRFVIKDYAFIHSISTLAALFLSDRSLCGSPFDPEISLSITAKAFMYFYFNFILILCSIIYRLTLKKLQTLSSFSSAWRTWNSTIHLSCIIYLCLNRLNNLFSFLLQKCSLETNFKFFTFLQSDIYKET